MKIIEGLKKIKELLRKCSDYQNKIRDHCVKMSFEEDKYVDQRGKIESWVKAHTDMVREIESLKERISKTNLSVMVPIEIGGVTVTKSIHGWISRRQGLADLEKAAWDSLNDRGMRDQRVKGSNDKDIVDFKLVRFYDPSFRDKMVETLSSERYLIDSKLEVVNAITDLVD